MSMPEPAAGPVPVTTERVNIPMRDGTLLAASVTLPPGPGPFPTILTRTPYDRTNQVPAADQWGRAGFAFVREDVRGRFDSEGEFYPFRDDPLDGFDTIQWITEQPWSNGKVGTTGASHVGTVQYLAAPMRPPGLAAAMPEFAPVSVYDRWWYQGGAFRLNFNLAWAILLANDNLRHYPDRMRRLLADRDQVWVTPDEMRALQIKPLFREWSAANYETIANVFGNNWFDEFMDHPGYGPFWEPYDFTRSHSEMETPMLHVGGWYDTFCQGTIDSFVGLRANARTEAARDAQRLIVGPWRHVNWGQSDVGELDFAPGVLEVDPFQTRRQWFSRWLTDSPESDDDGPPVLIFVMGENAWRAEQEWPLARTRPTSFYLHADGSLDTGEPVSEPPRTFTYDPSDPVITLGGCEWVNYPCGPFDQVPLDGRSDILRFMTEPLTDDVEITGQVFAHVWASSSAPDTDITVKLIDVHPDGRAYNLCDGIRRGAYGDGLARQGPLEAGTPYEFVVDLWSTSNLFRKGHRIRVDISSSNFPRFDANPNSGQDIRTPATERRRIIANNTIHFSRQHPSRVVLPVIPR